MSLDASRLANAIKTAVDSIDVSSGEIDNTEAIEALANAIIEEITSNAEVVVSSGSSAGTYQVS
ncbi:MAG: hypothetical protein GOVbin4162_35 [Prokaryotic dsDNA virus sp.]|nr:MAG: hypothetical protein GOVbin4162_35 [Prokaryotic dsDNA virus sp.]|tara:strand:- start:3152 stop:3343 length:192 start_codon:yes stop_codon:yes gene_type:complete